MMIRLLVRFNVKPECVDTFIDKMQEAKTALVNAPGCSAVEVLQSADDPCHVVLSEIWASREVHDEYAMKMTQADTMGALAQLLNGAPEPLVFNLK